MAEDLLPPDVLKERITILKTQRKIRADLLEQRKKELKEIRRFLELEPLVALRLEALSRDLFRNILEEIEKNLTYALQDILGQDIKLGSTQEVKYDKFHVNFHVERKGCREDILRGQGGSVCNILSVGLRFITLTQLDEKDHRKFLVLDEQDCWIRPDLVPRFMGVIKAISERLGFQVVVISHHDVELFRDHADAIYRFSLVKASDGLPAVSCTIEKGPSSQVFDPL
ncbi:hypothetical protein [Thermodesulforhabdus norvegica]|uniref:Uncharacterized protein n=1 Tax=Thermodesulforhabdus norvegica TaxID=39841 RepID=A0A1I4UX49_9BACT|nr:hypothetical protein [Thermodesulforhabdus norvegica]SFM93579.1 hypothetical protein SAMN05660836_02022 [Thermodesulforhabdus norvegica]